MKILICTTHYTPDGGAAASLFSMLAAGLVERGHSVTVIAAVPHYPSGMVPLQYRSWRAHHTQENGVGVIRVHLPSLKRSRFSFRLLQFVAYQVRAVLIGRRLDYDILLTHSPSLETLLVFVFLGVLRRLPVLYSVHDLYPEVGIRQGIFRHKLVIRAVAALEDYCLRHAAQIRILSRSFRGTLVERGVPDEVIHLVYDWVDPQEIQPLPKVNPFSQEYDLTGGFVVLYVGNLGFIQGLGSLLECASRMRAQSDIRVAIVGDGAARQYLIDSARRLGLSSVRFIDYQPVQRMPEIFASADASLVSLKRGAAFGALPSKTYSILSSARPVIAAVDPGSDAWDLVERAAAGICVPPEDPDALAEAILRLRDDLQLRQSYAHNGRNYVLNHHSPASAAESFERLLQAAVDQFQTRALEGN